MRQELAVLGALWAGIFLPEYACAQSISQDTAMSFGTFSIDPGVASGSITVNISSSTSVTGSFFSLVGGNAGTYTVTGMPVSTALSVIASEVDSLDTPANSASATLLLGSFDLPGSPASDPSGVLTFDMGVTASTKVNSSQYNSGNYTGVVLVTVVVM